MKPIIVPELASAPLVPGGTWASVRGTAAGVISAGIKKPNDPPSRDDVVVLLATGTAAAVTTRSTAAAAPCLWTRARVPGPVSAIVVNSGNANASTGPQGARDTAATAEAVADELGCHPDAVLVCSTGVIGVPLPMPRLLSGVRAAVARARDDHGLAEGHRAAAAILTTDLVSKQAAVFVDGMCFGGMAKGSGMIHPNMGTMLGFVATDALVPAAALQRLVEEISDRTFNCVTVDGDTSTNDTLIVVATGLGPEAVPGTTAWADLTLGLETICRHLARAIAADGEGARHLIEVVVMGTESDAEARAAARAVARSPLVKSAIHGLDPNWGRIVGALGAAGVAGLDALDLDLAGVPVLRAGSPVDWDGCVASTALEAYEVRITARLPGPGIGYAWGCDLSADYVRINADYRS